MSFGPRIPFNECAALTFRTNFQNIFNRDAAIESDRFTDLPRG
jgi:hypothetical protein